MTNPASVLYRKLHDWQKHCESIYRILDQLRTGLECVNLNSIAVEYMLGTKGFYILRQYKP